MFLVVIAGSLIALVVASFMRLVIRDQSQASNQDLSQSAYDSAQVGVEDAKRFMQRYARQCANGYVNSTECDSMKKQLDSNDCNALFGDGKEVVVRSADGDESLNQAYTCLKIVKNTADFVGVVTPGSSKIVPLKGVGNFSKIRLSWHSKEDMTTDGTISLDTVSSDPRLVTEAAWNRNSNRPAVIKAQYFGYTSAMNELKQLDDNFSKDGNGLDEQIYYPSSNKSPAANNSTSLSTSRRLTQDNSGTLKQLSPVQCANNLSNAAYACHVVVSLGHTVKTSDVAFVRLTPIYKTANFKVELLDDANRVVDFDGVQPKVDSTGRANDQFRRVESRIEFEDQNLPVPDFALQLEDPNGVLCKNFWVTNLTNNIPEAEKTCNK